MARWSKKRSLEWIKKFSDEWDVVPSTALRQKHDGPPDEELIRLFGSVYRALELGGAPMATASLGGGTVHKYEHGRGGLNQNILRKEEWIRAQNTMNVGCTLCDWRETHDDPFEGLLAGRRHRYEAHGIERPKKRRGQKPKRIVTDRWVGGIPGVGSGSMAG